MEQKYLTHISSKHNILDFKLKEVWEYRDLIVLFTKRTFKVAYKQTILGPLWLFINPVITSIFQMILFGGIAKLGTDGIPQILFYLSSNAIWGFFSSCMNGNCSTFTGNAGLFGKVYFPRLVMPISTILSAVVSFGIKMILVILLLLFFIAQGMVSPDYIALLLLPFVLLWLGLLGMGFGIIVSSMTTKYRDLGVLVGFGTNLWMYATPVVYPMSRVHGWLKTLILINPVTMPVEIYRHALLGVGAISYWSILLSIGMTVVVLTIGIMIFNKVERTFMDTV